MSPLYSVLPLQDEWLVEGQYGRLVNGSVFASGVFKIAQA